MQGRRQNLMQGSPGSRDGTGGDRKCVWTTQARMVPRGARKSQARRQRATWWKTCLPAGDPGRGESRATGHQDRDRPDDGAAEATPPEVDRSVKTLGLPAWQVVNKRSILLIECFCVNKWLFLTVLSRARFLRARRKKTRAADCGAGSAGAWRAAFSGCVRGCAAGGRCRRWPMRSAGRRYGSRSAQSAPWSRSWRR